MSATEHSHGSSGGGTPGIEVERQYGSHEDVHIDGKSWTTLMVEHAHLVKSLEALLVEMDVLRKKRLRFAQDEENARMDAKEDVLLTELRKLVGPTIGL